MKRILAFLCALTLVMTLCVFYTGTAATVSADAAPAREVVEVSTYDAFRAAVSNAANSGKTVKLTADLDLNPGWVFTFDDVNNVVVATKDDTVFNISTGLDGTSAAGTFTRVSGTAAQPAASAYGAIVADGVWVDGNGHKITGFLKWINNSTTGGTGYGAIFGTVNQNCKVFDLTVENSAMIVRKTADGQISATGFAYNVKGDVYNVTVKTIVTAAVTGTAKIRVGGIATIMYPDVVGESVAATALEAYEQDQGGAYIAKNPTIVDSVYDGLIVWHGLNTDNMAGGIVGEITSGEVYNCTNYADMTSLYGRTYGMGGIVGVIVPQRSSYIYGAARHAEVYNNANYGDITAAGIDGDDDKTTESHNSAAGIVGFVNFHWSTSESTMDIANNYNTGVTVVANRGVIGRVGTGAGSTTVGGYTFNRNRPSVYNKNSNSIPTYYDGAFGSIVANVSNTGTAPYTYTSGTLCQGGQKNVGATDNVILSGSSGICGTTSALNSLNFTAKYLPHARQWVDGGDGKLHIDYATERTYAGTEDDPIMISTASELNNFQSVYANTNQISCGLSYNVKLASDISLNAGTFGFDSDALAATYTKDATTYYFGTGKNDLTRGTWYVKNGDVFETTTAPTLSVWNMLLSSGQDGRINVNFDGGDHTIHGVYASSSITGFACNSWNMHLSNLTIDGIINGTSNAAGFIGNANANCSVYNCTNNCTILSSNHAGGIVGRGGVDRAADNLWERHEAQIPRVMYCTNNGAVISTGNYVGGIMGYVMMGLIHYNKNAAPYICNGTAAAALVGGIIGKVELGTHYPNVTAYGVTNSNNWARPLETICEVIGNVNISDNIVQNGTGHPDPGGIVGDSDPCWLGAGAVVGATTSGDVTTYTLVKQLPSRYIVSANINASSVASHYGWRWSTATGNYWTIDGVKLSQVNKSNIGRTSTNCYNKADIKNTGAPFKVFSAALDPDSGYFAWPDYQQINGGAPVLMKRENGLSITGAGIQSDPFILSTKEDLILFHDTANSFVDGFVTTINGVTVSNINEAQAAGASAFADGNGVLTNGSIGTVSSVYASASNAVRYYVESQLTGLGFFGHQTYNGMYIELGADIDMKDGDEYYEWTTMYGVDSSLLISNANSTPNYGFRGFFDGKGHTISGLEGVAVGAGGANFINGVLLDTNNPQNPMYIKNLTIADSTFTGAQNTSALTGFCNAVIDNCHAAADVTVTGAYGASGLVSWNQKGTVTNCTNRADVTGAQMVGGVCASVNGAVTDSVNYGEITGTSLVGGVCGAMDIQTANVITGLVNYGDVTATGATGYCGGITAQLSNIMTEAAYAVESNIDLLLTDCTNYGDVSSVYRTGGILGYAVGTSNTGSYTRTFRIENCTNVGDVSTTTEFAGGIVAMAGSRVEIRDCVNNGTVFNEHSVPAANLQTLSVDVGNGATAGIIAWANAYNIIEGNVNNGDILAPNTTGAAGIIAQVADAGATYSEILNNVNNGTVTAQACVAGIAAAAIRGQSAHHTLIKGNINNGDVHGTLKNAAGILSWKSRTFVTVCYNINNGKVYTDGNAGGILGTSNAPLSQKVTTVYGNINTGKVYNASGTNNRTFYSGIYSSGEGYNMYNYSLDTQITGNGTGSIWSDVIDGDRLTLSDLANGSVAATINAVDLEDEAAFDAYFAARNVTKWDPDQWTNQDVYVTPFGYEKDAVVYYQTLGVDLLPTFDDTHDVPAAYGAGTLPACALENFVAYVDRDGAFYAPGDTLAEDTFLAPVAVNFYTMYGAGVRTATPTGLRYKTVVESVLKDIPIDVTFGTFIVPTSFVDACVSNYGEFSAQVLVDNNVQKIDIPNAGWYNVGSDSNVYCGSVVRIKDANLTREYSSVSYMRIDYANGTTAYISGGYEDSTGNVAAAYNAAANSRTVVAVATAALADPYGGYSEEVRATLQAYIDAASYK